MGLSLGIGVSLSIKKQNKDNKVYVILGDGECNEDQYGKQLWQQFISN